MTDKQKAILTADQIRDRATGEFESQVSQQLAELPHAPYTVQVSKLMLPVQFQVNVWQAGDAEPILTHTIPHLTEHYVWLIVTLVKGQIYTLPPPQPVVDMEVIDKQITTLRQREEKLTVKLTISRESSAKWEARATLAEAKLAGIRLMTLADLRTTDANAVE